MASSPDITKLAEHLREVTDHMLAHDIARGAGLYKRERHLPLLLGASWQTSPRKRFAHGCSARSALRVRRLQLSSGVPILTACFALKQAFAGEQRRAH